MDVVNQVVTVAAFHRHRQSRLARIHAVCAAALDGPGGQDVVQGRASIAPAGEQGEAEILGVAVGGAHDPEHYLRPEEVLAVCVGVFGTAQDIHDLTNTRAAVAFVLAVRRQSGDLAEILLRNAQPVVAVACANAIEALDDQGLLVFETANFSMGNGQAVFAHQGHAKPFQFDRHAHVSLHIADQSQGQFENVGGWRGAVRNTPASAMPQQCGLFLRTGNRQAKRVVVDRLARVSGQRGVAQYIRDPRFVERRGLDAADVARVHSCGQQLDGADAVAADRREQVEGGRGARAMAIAQALQDALVVRNQVLEVGGDLVAAQD